MLPLAPQIQSTGREFAVTPDRAPRDRPHPLRLAALTCLFAGIVMITVFAAGMLQRVHQQQEQKQPNNGLSA